MPDGFRKATKGEMRFRVERVAQMIAAGNTKGEVKRFLKQQYGLGFRTAERYMRLARESLVEAISIPKEDLVAQSYGFYMGVVSSTDAELKEKLSARAAADKLLGLPAPIKVAPTTPDGKQPWKEAVSGLTDDELRAITKAGERMREVVAGASGSGSN